MDISGTISRNKRGLIVFGVGAVAAYVLARTTGARINFGASPDVVMLGQLGGNILSAVLGFAAGFLPIFLFKRYRDIAAALAAVGLLYVALLPGVGIGMAFAVGTIAFIAGVVIALGRGKSDRSTTLGSAQWADLEEIKQKELIGKKGLLLGTFPIGEGKATRLRYAGDRHFLTVAPTRTGKGTCSVVPNLLTYTGAALVIDPKGENAHITAKRRKALGQSVALVDPWGVASAKLGVKPARFNPIDWLDADDPDLAENAMLLADALVVPSGKGEQFWDEEAKALLMGLILYVATQPEEKKNRTLGRVRELLTKDGEAIKGLFAFMTESSNPIVKSTGGRCLQKDEKTLANVLASAQAHTHFLDSPRIKESLSASDFQFEDLKAGKTTIYLILPSERLHTFGRWLRLLVQQAITVRARQGIASKDEPAVLFMLDELPALGHLQMVEQAYSLMAGFGMQLWGIVQDLSQLKKIYGESWETFVGNSGVLQYFGSRDKMTAEYFSSLCGTTTVWTLSTAISRAVGAVTGGNDSTTHSEASRPLLYPDELMRLHDTRQIVLVENMNPILGTKVKWFEDQQLEPLGVNLHKQAASPALGAKPGAEALPVREARKGHKANLREPRQKTESSADDHTP